MGAVVIGVSVGQGHHPSALTVVEAVEEIIRVDPEPCGCDPKSPSLSPEWRPLGYQEDSRWRCQRCGTRVKHVAFAEHFSVRLMEELPEATYSELAGRVREVWEGSQEHEPTSTLVYADLTGLGLPFLDLLLKRGPPKLLALPVFTTHGDRREVTDLEGENPLVTLGKGYLVSQLQLLLQDGRLHLSQGAESVAQELLAVVAEMPEDANDRYGAWSTGPNDHQVTALGLATQLDPTGRQWRDEIEAAKRLRRHRLASGKPVDHSLPENYRRYRPRLTSW